MTAVERRVQVREVVGTPAQLAAVVGSLRGRGYQVRVVDRREVGDRVTAQLHVTPAPVRPVPQPVPVRRPLWRRRWPYVTVGVLLLAGLVTAAVIWLVHMIVAHLALVVGGLVLLGVALIGLGRAGVCPGAGIHCPGCGH